MDIKKIRVNEKIRVPEIQLIDENGKRIGIKPVSEALRIASERGLDLVEVAPNTKPPVCKIIDFSKFRYEQEQKLKIERKKTKAGQIKEIRFNPTISDHDLQFKLSHIREFIENKYRVKITIILAGRMMEHRELAYNLFNKISENLSDIAVVTDKPDFDKNRLVSIIAPKK